MPYNAGILLGRIQKVQGYDGTLSVKLDKDFTEDISDMESVFIEYEGKPVPFFISSMEDEGGDIIKLRLEGYDTYDKASMFAGCRMSLTSGRRREEEDDNSGITGFTVILSNQSIAGVIEEIIQNPGQDLLRILSPEKKEILVPLHSDLITGINKKKRTLSMDLPEGLLEIN
ncbi:MAG TPA: 16S rRNA processing protein RimM [Bacteroidales bacterium]|nr:16S rRNA processing protein RimM [Bacteroidales bacterium]